MAVSEMYLPFLLFSSIVACGFFASSLVLMIWGYRFGERHLSLHGEKAFTGHGSTEGAVFALLGLILAFTISGALQRFDDRRQLSLKEGNSISTAYDRLDLLDGETRNTLKSKLREYLKTRIDLYREGIDFSFLETAEVASPEYLDRIEGLKAELWSGAVSTCRSSERSSICSMIVSSLSEMFDAARARNGANQRHPPPAIFLMLFMLGLGSSYLAGVSMAAARRRSWVHMVSFAAALAMALFVISDIEFPRLGLVRVNSFDQHLINLYEQMERD
jgi:hypothetical protein